MAADGQGTAIELPMITVGPNDKPPEVTSPNGGSGRDPTTDGLDQTGAKGHSEHHGEGPAPASAKPAPPIGLRASHKGRVIAVAPDVKYVGARGQNPTPFITRGYTDDQEHYSPNVRYEGDNAMRFNSDITKTYGGQPGTGRGVKSDTYMDRAFPKTHSDNVFINGSPAMRKGDLFHHNGSSPDNANTIGKAQHPGPEDPKEAPPKTSWWGRQFNRAVGVVGLVGSAAEGVAGGALFAAGTGADATGVGAVAGVPAQIGGGAMVLNAADQGWANAKQIWTGEPQDTYLQKGVSAAATAMGASPETASQASAVAGLGQAVAVPGAALAKTGKLAEVGKAAEEAQTAAKAKKEAQIAEEAAADGSGGVRVAKPKSKRDQYLGSTPGKNSRTGREVRERMREEGNLRENPETGRDEFKADDGNWYPVDSPSTHMGHYPQDAVDYWNETGRDLGAKSPEVRQWMLDSDNYRFEYGPENMSRGGSTTSRYLPPSQ